MSTKEIKLKSKKLLKDNFAPLILAACFLLLIMIIFSLCEYIIRSITGINAYDSVIFSSGGFTLNNLLSVSILVLSFILQYIVISPLMMGLWRCLYLITEGKNIQIGNLFYFYSSPKLFFRSILLRINIFLRELFYLLILFLPAFVASFFLSDYAAAFFKYNLSTFASSALMFAAAVFWIGAVIFYIIILLRYSFAGIIAASDDKLKINRSIKLSIKRSNGYKLCIFKLIISFIGWFALCIFIFPIIYVLPYFCLGIAVLAADSNSSNN